MKLRTIVSPALVLLAAGAMHAQEADFPGASDFPNLTRPAASRIIGAHRVDNDEFLVPMGSMERGAKQPGKTMTVTGSVDTLIYAGSKTASSFSTYAALEAQLKAAGYALKWSCVRSTCGSGFDLASYLSQPIIDSIHTGNWGSEIIGTINATNDDVRYGAFQKGGETMIVLASLQPGAQSGALLIRISNPPATSVLQASVDQNGSQQGATTVAANSTPGAAGSQTGNTVRQHAKGWLNRALQ